MKEFKLNIGQRDIIIQVPEDHEIQREEAFAVALVKLQDIIADGIYPITVTKRVWPCIFCDKNFKDQPKLMAHVRSDEHKEKAKSIKGLADKHMKKPEVEKESKTEAKNA
jgi:hypothetical protein